MKPLLYALLIFVKLTSNGTAEMINGSTSPNRKWEVVADKNATGIIYHVASREGRSASPDLTSDFGMSRSLAAALSRTAVFWSPDNRYLVISSGHDRIHEDFFILRRGAADFTLLPFDWELALKSAHLVPMGFGYPSFLEWKPGDRVGIEIMQYDGRDTVQPVDVVLDLPNNLATVSYKIGNPVRAY